jgi:hypothetical protein
MEFESRWNDRQTKFLEEFQRVIKKLQDFPLVDVIFQWFNYVGNIHIFTDEFTNSLFCQ